MVAIRVRADPNFSLTGRPSELVVPPLIPFNLFLENSIAEGAPLTVLGARECDGATTC